MRVSLWECSFLLALQRDTDIFDVDYIALANLAGLVGFHTLHPKTLSQPIAVNLVGRRYDKKFLFLIVLWNDRIDGAFIVDVVEAFFELVFRFLRVKFNAPFRQLSSIPFIPDFDNGSPNLQNQRKEGL
ncbi:MAG: hypothetical protein ACI4AM_01205, partial [Muribaculaceae bacterium]